MERIIKFRCWDKNSNQMSKPFELQDLQNSCFQLTDKAYRHVYDIGSKMILMQFTGLTDKNGVEIYEGDILKISAGHESMVVKNYHVVFEFGAFQFRTPCMRLPAAFVSYADQCYQNDMIDKAEEVFQFIEVIGNIHEHPHLLTQQKQ